MMKCFLCCHVRHLNLVERNPQRITKEVKEIVMLKIKIISVLMCFVMRIN